VDLIVESDADFELAEYLGARAGFEKVPGVALGFTVFAQVNRGRWLVECPHCPSARLTAPGRLFWCPSCGNRAVAGQGMTVDWPADWETIERLLMVRPVENRNWVVRRSGAESVAELAAENVAHGLPDCGVAARSDGGG
jgi:hypothetical protein